MVVKINIENYQVCKNRIEIVISIEIIRKKIKTLSQFIQLLVIKVFNLSSL